MQKLKSLTWRDWGTVLIGFLLLGYSAVIFWGPILQFKHDVIDHNLGPAHYHPYVSRLLVVIFPAGVYAILRGLHLIKTRGVAGKLAKTDEEIAQHEVAEKELTSKFYITLFVGIFVVGMFHILGIDSSPLFLVFLLLLIIPWFSWYFINGGKRGSFLTGFVIGLIVVIFVAVFFYIVSNLPENRY